MRTVFADTFYWVALADPKDQWHATVKRVSKELGPCHIVTSDEVLVEFLTSFCRFGKPLREMAIRLVRSIRSDPNITVVPQTRDSFDSGLALFAARSDKEYSMTDCTSMDTMRQRKMKEVLTHDHHFTQEGFVILFTEPDL